MNSFERCKQSIYRSIKSVPFYMHKIPRNILAGQNKQLFLFLKFIKFSRYSLHVSILPYQISSTGAHQSNKSHCSKLFYRDLVMKSEMRTEKEQNKSLLQ